MRLKPGPAGVPGRRFPAATGLSLVLRLAVSGFLFYLLLAPGAARIAPFFPVAGEIGPLLGVIREANPPFFLGGALLFGAAFLLIVLRWKVLMDYPPVGFPTALKLTLVGFFFNNFLPTAAGGDLVKGYYLLRGRTNRLDLGLSIVMDRLVGAFSILSLGLAVVVFRHRDLPPAFSLAITAVFGLLALVLVAGHSRRAGRILSALVGLGFARRFRKPVLEAASAFTACLRKRGVFLGALAISYASQVFVLLSHYLVARSFGARVDIPALLVGVPLVWCAGALPSLGGLGVREMAYAVFLKGAVEGSGNAAAMALVFLGFNLLLGLPGGIAGLSGPRPEKAGRPDNRARAAGRTPGP